MLYQSYEKKIAKIAKIFDFLIKHKVLILSIIGTILAFLTVFLSTKGMFIQDLTLTKTEMIYGDEYAFSAKALFSDVNYEFSKIDEDNWIADSPTSSGEYKVRALSNASFGNTRYSQEVNITILKKNLDLSINESQITYGENLSYSHSELVNQDKITDAKITISSINAGDRKALVEDSSIKIVDKNNVDVTDCYQFNCIEKDVKILKKPLSIKGKDAKKTYDGTPLSYSEYTHSELEYNDKLTCNFSNSITDVGEIVNEFSIKITDENGNILNDNYDISSTFGKLSINKRPVKFKPKYIEKTYDGEIHSCNEIEQVALQDENSGLIENDYIFEKQISGQREIFGKTQTQIENIKIYSQTEQDEQKKDKTLNYDISFEKGEININKRPIKLDCDIEKTYDHQILSTNSDSINLSILQDGLVQNHLLEIKTNNVNAFEYKLSNLYLTIIDKEDDDNSVIDNYLINLDNAKLTINKRPIKLDCDIEKTYDHQILSTNSDSINLSILQDGLVQNHYAEIKTNSVNASEYNANNKNLNLSIINKNDGNRSVIDNYQIDLDEAKLTIKKRPISITTGSKTFTYNGKAQTISDNTKYTYTPYGLNEGLLYGQDLSINNLKSITNVWETENENNVIEKEDVSIKQGSIPVASNYEISLFFGTLTMREKIISVNFYGEKIYDGRNSANKDIKMLIMDEYGYSIDNQSYSQSFNLFEGQQASISEYNLIGGDNLRKKGIDAFGYQIDAKIDIKKNGNSIVKDDHEYKENYDITYNIGQYTISKRPYSIKTNSDEKQYDRIKYTKERLDEIGYQANNIVYIHKIQITTYHALDKVLVGTHDNRYTYDILDEDNLSVRYNYILDDDVPNPEQWGILTIKKIPITIKIDGQAKLYTTQQVEIDNKGKIKQGAMFASDSFEIINSKAYLSGLECVPINVDTYTIKGDANINYDDDNYGSGTIDSRYHPYYDVTLESSTLHIMKAHIIIKTATATREYKEGQPLTDNRYNIIMTELDVAAPIVINVIGSQEKVGSSENLVDSIIIEDEEIPVYGEGTYEGKNIIVTIEYGILKVTDPEET